MADDPAPRKESFGKTLKAKVLGVPLGVVLVGGVLAGAWYLRRRAAAQAAAADQGQPQSASNNPGLADTSSGTLPYMGSPVFLTVTSPNVPSDTGSGSTGGGTGSGSGSGSGGGSAGGGTGSGSGSGGGSTTPPTSTPPTSTPPPPPPVTSQTYVVHSGDTLSAIAAREHVPGGWVALYKANAKMLDDIARSHGETRGDLGLGPGSHWIYPNERLVLPSGSHL